MQLKYQRIPGFWKSRAAVMMLRSGVCVKPQRDTLKNINTAVESLSPAGIDTQLQYLFSSAFRARLPLMALIPPPSLTAAVLPSAAVRLFFSFSRCCKINNLQIK